MAALTVAQNFSRHIFLYCNYYIFFAQYIVDIRIFFKFSDTILFCAHAQMRLPVSSSSEAFSLLSGNISTIYKVDWGLNLNFTPFLYGHSKCLDFYLKLVSM